MNGNRHVFRPSWVPNLGLTLGLVVGVLAFGPRLVPSLFARPSVGYVYGLAAGLVAATYLRWKLRGHIEIDAQQVVVKGWVSLIGPDEARHTRYVSEYIPRSLWDSIRVEGLIFPRVIVTRFSKQIVFEQVAHPRQLRRLLDAPPEAFGAEARPGVGMLMIIGLGALFRLVAGVVGRLALSLVQLIHWARPYLGNAYRVLVRELSHRGMQLWTRFLGRPRLSQSSSGPIEHHGHEYRQFLRFCQALCGGQRDLVDHGPSEVYLQLLQRAHIVAAGDRDRTWTLHPRIRCVRDIELRIPEDTFMRAVFGIAVSTSNWERSTASRGVPIPAVSD